MKEALALATRKGTASAVPIEAMEIGGLGPRGSQANFNGVAGWIGKGTASAMPIEAMEIGL